MYDHFRFGVYWYILRAIKEIGVVQGNVPAQQLQVSPKPARIGTFTRRELEEIDIKAKEKAKKTRLKR